MKFWTAHSGAVFSLDLDLHWQNWFPDEYVGEQCDRLMAKLSKLHKNDIILIFDQRTWCKVNQVNSFSSVACSVGPFRGVLQFLDPECLQWIFFLLHMVFDCVSYAVINGSNHFLFHNIQYLDYCLSKILRYFSRRTGHAKNVIGGSGEKMFTEVTLHYDCRTIAVEMCIVNSNENSKKIMLANVILHQRNIKLIICYRR